MSQSSIIHTAPPTLSPPGAPRSVRLASMELRYAIEAETARSLRHGAPSDVSRGCPAINAKSCEHAIVLRCTPLGEDDRACRLVALLAAHGEEIELLDMDVEIAIEHGPRMLHLDARERESGSPAPTLLAVSIDRDNGRVVYARSALSALLGLPGGSYDPPAVTIV